MTLDFQFDAEVPCTVAVHFAARETVGAHGELVFMARDPGAAFPPTAYDRGLRTPCGRGATTGWGLAEGGDQPRGGAPSYRHPEFVVPDLARTSPAQLVHDGGPQIPVVIHLEVRARPAPPGFRCIYLFIYLFIYLMSRLARRRWPRAARWPTRRTRT